MYNVGYQDALVKLGLSIPFLRSALNSTAYQKVLANLASTGKQLDNPGLRGITDSLARRAPRVSSMFAAHDRLKGLMGSAAPGSTAGIRQAVKPEWFAAMKERMSNFGR